MAFYGSPLYLSDYYRRRSYYISCGGGVAWAELLSYYSLYMFKYRNIPTIINGITFDSKKEALRYKELLLLERANEINLSYNQFFSITKNGNNQSDILQIFNI